MEFRRPNQFGRYWDKMDIMSAIGLVGELHLMGHLDGVVGLLGTGVVPRYFDAPRRMDLLRISIAQGAIIAWREIPDFKGPSYADRPVPNDILAPMYREHARRIGMDAGTRVGAPKTKQGHKAVVPAPAAVPSAGAGQPLNNTTNESCPSHTHRSESHRTAASEVLVWLKDPGGLPTSIQQDDVLGAAGGGGFLVSTTRVSTLRKGTIVYRYYDAGGGAKNDGGWWTTQLVAGDPRQTLALPPADPKYSNSAKSLARA